MLLQLSSAWLFVKYSHFSDPPLSFSVFFFYLSLSFLVQNRSKRVRAFSRTSEASDRLDDVSESVLGDEVNAAAEEELLVGDDGASRTRPL